ncbi:MAG: PAS domain S-box protein [Gemmatimonadota bacterium]
MSPAEKVRVLVIDDDPGDFTMARALIEAIDDPSTEYRVDWASTYPEALDTLDQKAYDVFIVDYFLEDHDGLELVREARRRGVREPMIMLTGRGSREVDVEAMKAGASDYLVKGKIDPDLMERAIRYALERRRAEEALRDSEERHRSMFDHLPIGLYRVSPEGDFMEANPALVRILGYPDASTLQQRWASQLFVNPDDRERFVALLEREGVARGFETTLELEDGTQVRVRNTARAHRDPDGATRYLEGAVEDVTDERWAARLRESAERFDAVYQRSGLALVLVDLDGAVVEGNTAFLRTFGYSNDRIRGTPLSDLGAAADRPPMAADVEALSQGEKGDLDVERRLVGGDGTVLWARLRGTLIRDSAGQPNHVLLMLEDVAETGEKA